MMNGGKRGGEKKKEMDRLDMLHQGQDIPLPASDEELFLIAARETSRSLGLERCVVSAEAEAARLRGVITELRQEAAQRSAAHRAEASVLAARIEELEHEKGALVEFVSAHAMDFRMDGDRGGPAAAAVEEAEASSETPPPSPPSTSPPEMMALREALAQARDAAEAARAAGAAAGACCVARAAEAADAAGARRGAEGECAAQAAALAALRRRLDAALTSDAGSLSALTSERAAHGDSLHHLESRVRTLEREYDASLALVEKQDSLIARLALLADASNGNRHDTPTSLPAPPAGVRRELDVTFTDGAKTTTASISLDRSVEGVNL